MCLIQFSYLCTSAPLMTMTCIISFDYGSIKKSISQLDICTFTNVSHHHFNIENMLHQMCYVVPRSGWKCWAGWAGENVICDCQEPAAGSQFSRTQLQNPENGMVRPGPGTQSRNNRYVRAGRGWRHEAGGRLQLRKPPKCAECGRGVEGGPLTGAGWGCQPSALPPPYCDKICTITPTLHVTILS